MAQPLPDENVTGLIQVLGPSGPPASQAVARQDVLATERRILLEAHKIYRIVSDCAVHFMLEISGGAGCTVDHEGMTSWAPEFIKTDGSLLYLSFNIRPGCGRFPLPGPCRSR